jgi:hypothetical protein
MEGCPGHGGHIGGTREARGRFLALQPAEASFKPREIVVTDDLVAAPTRRAKGLIVTPGRMSLRDGPFARLVRHRIEGVKRLPWRGTHISVLPI